MNIQDRTCNAVRYVISVPTHFIGYEETRQEPLTLVKGILAEFFGTILLVFVWTGASLSMGQANFDSKVSLSLCIGFIVASMVMISEHVSGGHLNPAVTLGFFASGKISAIKGISYILSQMLGGIVGCAILLGVGPSSESRELSLPSNVTVERHNGSEYQFNLTAIKPTSEITVYQTLGIEFITSVIIVLVYLSVRDENRQEYKGSGAFGIGFSFTACHLAFINYTGLAMNPARSFGAAVISQVWEYHWIYWVGPLIAALVAAFLHYSIFRATVPSAKVFNEKDLEILQDPMEHATAVPLEEIAIEVKSEDQTTNPPPTITTATVSNEPPVEIEIPVVTEESKEELPAQTEHEK